MLNHKLSLIVIDFIGKKEIKRHLVTARIKNYPKIDRESAIEELVTGEYVTLRRGESKIRGRSPVFIRLTERGVSEFEKNKGSINDMSIWNI